MRDYWRGFGRGVAIFFIIDIIVCAILVLVRYFNAQDDLEDVDSNWDEFEYNTSSYIDLNSEQSESISCDENKLSIDDVFGPISN